MATIDIKGLDKATLLAAFYNYSRPMGMGFLQAREGNMTEEEARKIIEKGDDTSRMFPGSRSRSMYFDYVYGRPLKIDLSGDTMETSLYDRDNGAGAGARVVSTVRQNSGK